MTTPDFSQEGRQMRPAAAPDPDEINLLEYAYALVHRKWLIIGVTVAGAALGLAAALVKGPTYVSEAVIAPKESDAQKTPNLSGLGALGGLMATQFTMGGNASLDKIAQVMKTRKFNADLIDSNNLLPFIYKYQMRTIYRKMYDSAAQAWRADFVKPKPLDMGDYLKKLVKSEIKDNAMTIKVQSGDSTFSKTIMTLYLEYLDRYLRESVQNDAKENEMFLENRLLGAPDPLLREKIQSLIANEVEKQMLVSKEAFRVIDPQYSYVNKKRMKLFPLVFGFGMFFLSVLWVVFVHAFTSGEKTEEDRVLLGKIRRELRFGRIR